MLNFQRLFESLPGLFIIYDLDFVIVGGSDAYFQATLTKREEVVGRHLFEVFPDNPDDPNADGVRNLRASLESVLKYRKPHTMAVQKYDIRRPDSVGGGFEERYWTPVNFPLFDENGVMTHIIHRAEDVTEFVQVQQQRNEQRQLNQALQSRSDQMEMEIYARVQELKEVNEQLQVANEALSELDRAKTIFFSNVSHEFRTPLTLMLDPLDETLNRLNGQLPAVEREQLQMVQRNGQRLLKLVNTLLDFSRIEAGRMAAVYEPTDLAAFTAELASVFRSAIAQANLSLVVDCPPLAASAWVDREMWEKIVLNLLSNAFKFTLEGAIVVVLRERNDQIELEVRDTGIGIPADELPHIFERFYRVREAKGRTYEGTGIGLSLVQELVRLHGGTIEVSSVVDRGTSFVVSIPTGCAHLPQDRIGVTRTLTSTATGATTWVQEFLRWLPEEGNGDWVIGNGETPFSSPTSYSQLPTPPAARILLVDDNSDMRDYVKRLLSDQGYAVETAIDGRAALAAVEQQQPDLVLTDVMMPQLDGFGLLRELRANPLTREIPIILLSARAGEEARIEGLEAGANDYLTKPFSARELLARVEANLRLAQLRHEAEAALRASEAKYRTLFESIDEGFCIVEVMFNIEEKPVDYRFVQVNPAFFQLTGLPKDALGKTARELVPDLEEFWFEVYGQVALTGEAIRFENKSESMNRWFDVYASRAGDSASRHVNIVFNDITKRKQAEELARRAAELNAFRISLADALRPLADPIEVQATASRLLGEYLSANRVAYFEVRSDHYVVERDYVNGADAIPGGYPIDSFGPDLLAAYRNGCAVSASDVAADPNLSPNQKAAYAAIQIGAYIGIPLVKDGEFVAGLAVHTSEPRVWTADEVFLAEEVAERTWAAVERARAEALTAADLQDTQRLRELGARLVTEGDIQTLYQEILSAAIAITQADAGTVQLLDAATQDLVLIATQGIEPHIVEHFYRVSAMSNTPCGIALKEGDRAFVDFDVPQSEDPNGSRRMHKDAGYFSAQSTPLLTRAGKPIGMFSTHWRKHHRPSDRELRFLDLLARQAADLIEQRQTAIEREQLLAREQAARAEAAHANRIKDEFLAVLSHELRSPLNPILGWSRLLQGGKLDGTKTAQALATIERNAKLQSELIEDLLDVSRILQGKLSLTAAPVNLASIIRAAMETVRLAAEAKSIKLEASLAADVGLVSGDATRLQQVIWNLLSNAVKFTPKEGQVNIRLERLDSYAFITVSDTGQGIAPDFLPYVFDYFRQANATTTRNFGGLGLGLAIVRQIVELHGGTVRVESLGEGQGTTFVVQIPLMPTPSKVNQDERLPEPSLDLNGIKILIVDDDTDAREFVAFLLEQLGAQVISATSAHEALLILPQAKPDVLLSDIGMPDMDGYMLIQQVRTFSPEQGGQIPAIALTAYAGDMNQQQALAAGFQKHISKPIEAEKLIQVISSLIKA